MAKHVRTYVEFTDDLNGEIIPEGHGATFRFGWDGDAYEIDANDENAAAIRAMFGRLTDAGRKIGKFRPVESAPRKQQQKAVKAKEQPALPAAQPDMSLWQQEQWARNMFREIREWARGNGFPELGNWGKLPEAVREAWNTAHPDRPAPAEGAGRIYKNRRKATQPA